MAAGSPMKPGNTTLTQRNVSSGAEDHVLHILHWLLAIQSATSVP